MLAFYNVGDLIKRILDTALDASNGGDDENIYIITDVIEFTDEYNENSITEYAVMKIYPVEIYSPYDEISEKEAILYAKDGSDIALRTHRKISDYRKRLGYTGIPSFVKLLNTQMKSRKAYFENGVVKVSQKTNSKPVDKNAKKTAKAVITKKPFPMNTIDECLDAINDARLLYEMFSDKKYLKMEANALAKLVELTS